jgi:hypothetical protein
MIIVEALLRSGAVNLKNTSISIIGSMKPRPGMVTVCIDYLGTIVKVSLNVRGSSDPFSLTLRVRKL